MVTPVVSGGAGYITTDGTTYNIFKTGGGTRGYFDSTNFYLSSTGMLADGRILTATGTVSPYLVSGPGKSGTNVAGTNNVIQAEPGTGSATGSSIVFQTPTAGASGTGAQTQTTRLTVNEADATFAGPVFATAFTTSSGSITSLANVWAQGITINGAAGNYSTWTTGTGSPESVVTAPVGSFYSRLDGGAGTSWYVKESGTGNTGWIAK